MQKNYTMPKKFEVVKATTKEIPGLYVGGRERRFAANGSMTLSDAGEAAEIDKVLGRKGTGEVVVTSYDDKEPGHNYRFTRMGLRETMYDFSKDPDYFQVRPGVWRLKPKLKPIEKRRRRAGRREVVNA